MSLSAAIPLPEVWHSNNYFLKKLLERNCGMCYAMVSELTELMGLAVIVDVNTY